ncbi:hypothetical protein V8C35DRAFT_33498 [Trichoderma chlorosporum]
MDKGCAWPFYCLYFANSSLFKGDKTWNVKEQFPSQHPKSTIQHPNSWYKIFTQTFKYLIQNLALFIINIAVPTTISLLFAAGVILLDVSSDIQINCSGSSRYSLIPKQCLYLSFSKIYYYLCSCLIPGFIYKSFYHLPLSISFVSICY